MDEALAFAPSYPGSIPGLPAIGRWRNQAARCALNAEVSGSIPERPAKFLYAPVV